MQPINFTNISDQKLIFKNHLKILGNLTYYRVLTIDELFHISKYLYGIKSFRKLLLKFIKLELIGFQKDELTKRRYLFPTAKAIKFYKKNQFQKYLMIDTELITLKSYHAFFNLSQHLKRLESYQFDTSYIHEPHGVIDWSIVTDRRAQKKTSFFIFIEDMEKELFIRIKTAIDTHICHQLIILGNESDYLMTELITHYLKNYPRMIHKLYWYPITDAINLPLKHIKDDRVCQTTLGELFKEQSL